TNASVVGLLFERNTDNNGISAGVVGIDNTTTGNSKSFGGYFNTAYIGGVHVDVDVVTASFSILGDGGSYYSCYNTAAITIGLPPNPKIGRKIYIRRNNPDDVTINGNGKQIVNDSPVSSIDITGQWTTAMLMWDGTYWMYNVMPRQ